MNSWLSHSYTSKCPFSSSGSSKSGSSRSRSLTVHSDIEIMDWEGFVPDMQDKNYTDQLKARMNDRVNEIKAFATEKEGYDKLPDDALAAIQKVVDELK